MLPGTASYLNDCHWTLNPFRKRAVLTSDHPVSLVVSQEYPRDEGVGILTADLFLVPVTHRSALTIQPRQRLRRHTDDVDADPDFRYDGTTQIARSLNQETADRAHRYVYHRPHEDPVGLFKLPEPISERAFADNVDNLVREEGLFANTSRKVGAPLPPMPEQRGERGFSLDDLVWPIPNRIYPEAFQAFRRDGYRKEFPGHRRVITSLATSVRGPSGTIYVWKPATISAIDIRVHPNPTPAAG